MTYDLKPIKAPRVAGRALRMLTPVVEHPPLGSAITAKLLSDVGIKALRKIEADEAIAVGPAMTVSKSAQPPDDKDSAALAEQVVSTEIEQAKGFHFCSATDYVRAYKDGSTTPEQIAEKVLEWTAQTEKTDPPMRILIAQSHDDVRVQAKASARRYQQGDLRGPLDGVPVVVKDELDQKGYPTTVGTKFLGDVPSSQDAEVVARLRAAGAILIGKANMHEIGMGVTGVNPHHGAVRNPYDYSHVTGGSSSGPAASVAAGFCPIAVGADGGGSIRIPASFCGCVGIKPTFGRMSEHGAAPLCWSVAHVGPIAATVKDAALAYVLMAGPDEKDRNSLDRPAPHLAGFGDGDLNGVRLGVFWPWFEDAQPEVVAACKNMLTGLEAAGCQVVEIELPELSLVRTVHLVTIVSEMATAHMHYYKKHRKDYACDTRMNLALARRLKATDYVHAQRLRLRIAGHFNQAYQQVDAIVTPASGCVAPPIATDSLKSGESNLELTGEIMRFAQAANLTGLPAISFPAGYTDSGLPIGFQAMGRAFEEHLLFRLAFVAEGLVAKQQPKVFKSLL
ncbi:MAG: amidase [Deltaproteobacteria bacterium]|nr:amidase [Deltaproteobacteria bacterium]